MWAMSGKGPCEGCGGGVIHTGEEFLCAACYRISDCWKHLGPNLRDDAIARVKKCRATGAGLSAASSCQELCPFGSVLVPVR